MTDLERFGYVRALWIHGAEKHYLRPDGLSVVSETQALREIAERAGADDDEEADRR